jgi:hypothetical protein
MIQLRLQSSESFGLSREFLGVVMIPLTKHFWACSPKIGIRLTRRKIFYCDLNRNGVIELPQQQEVQEFLGVAADSN